jgi:hypothetical protein
MGRERHFVIWLYPSPAVSVKKRLAFAVVYLEVAPHPNGKKDFSLRSK